MVFQAYREVKMKESRSMDHVHVFQGYKKEALEDYMFHMTLKKVYQILRIKLR